MIGTHNNDSHAGAEFAEGFYPPSRTKATPQAVAVSSASQRVLIPFIVLPCTIKCVNAIAARRSIIRRKPPGIFNASGCAHFQKKTHQEHVK
jgi:hypothetical protein